jgi:hypothetical protein
MDENFAMVDCPLACTVATCRHHKAKIDCKRGSVHAGQVQLRRHMKRPSQNTPCILNRMTHRYLAGGHNEDSSGGPYRASFLFTSLDMSNLKQGERRLLVKFAHDAILFAEISRKRHFMKRSHFQRGHSDSPNVLRQIVLVRPETIHH